MASFKDALLCNGGRKSQSDGGYSAQQTSAVKTFFLTPLDKAGIRQPSSPRKYGSSTVPSELAERSEASNALRTRQEGAFTSAGSSTFASVAAAKAFFVTPINKPAATVSAESPGLARQEHALNDQSASTKTTVELPHGQKHDEEIQDVEHDKPDDRMDDILDGRIPKKNMERQSSMLERKGSVCRRTIKHKLRGGYTN